MTASQPTIAPGSIVIVRDEEWLVSSIEHTADGDLLTVRGMGGLVEGTSAQFYTSIDTVEAFDPALTRVAADTSPRYAQARLWLESTLRKTSLPISDPAPVMSTQGLADTLNYQLEAVRKALEPQRLRTRLLIADAVGLGKTLEIGMILSELIRRGRGRRILIVTPRHVLEQMQHEMWTRFAIPFVRLDSEGVQQVKQKLPATRNPFTFYEKVIVSIDTLKQDRFLHDLRHHHWDAVVIDESHNVTNQSTQNNQLARTLSPKTDALILASATPHNGRSESFAQLLRLLEPTSVPAQGEIQTEAVQDLMIRRHRYSPSVQDEVGHKWAERLEPRNVLAEPSPQELAVAQEIAGTWTHPQGSPPMTGKGSGLFPWTLAKAFLSSPVALEQTVEGRLASLRKDSDDDAPATAEQEALQHLAELNRACLAPEDESPRSGKYRELVRQLQAKKIGPRSKERAVVFAERVKTLGWLRENLQRDLGLSEQQVRVLHGGLTDIEQQEIVESFKQSTSPIRVLVTGDVASEGVNLHKQCHELIHYDIPWSLIRIEQRNGRIDRYGQEHPPQITTLLLDLEDVQGFSGDIHILTRLVEREREAHQKLGDAASLMGEYSGSAEEDSIRDVLRGTKDFDTAVPSPEQAMDDGTDWLSILMGGTEDEAAPEKAPAIPARTGLFDSDTDYLLTGLTQLYQEPDRAPGDGGVGLQIEHTNAGKVESIRFQPREDLKQRLQALPQSYLAERQVLERLQLTPDRPTAEASLSSALNDTQGSSWPATHYLSPLHPVLDWVADRSLSHLPRGEVFAVHGTVHGPSVVMQGIMTNGRGQNIGVSHMLVTFQGSIPLTEVFDNPAELFEQVGLNPQTVGRPVADASSYTPLIPQAVEKTHQFLKGTLEPAARAETQKRVDAWVNRMDEWSVGAQASGVQQRFLMPEQRLVEQQRELAQQMRPDRLHVRPLLVVVPVEGE